MLISTPKGKGWFFELFRRGKGDDPDYQSWNSPSWENPHLDKEMIYQERDRLPERVFEQEYGGQFIEGSGAVFRKVREAATGDFQEPLDSEPYFAGLDLAKVEDYTVLVIMNRLREVVLVDRFHRLDWSHQVQRIRAATEKFNHASIYCDTTGVGEPIYESLQTEGCYVMPYPFTAKSKTALIDNLALMLEQEMITLPKPDLWPIGLEELEAFQYSVSETGHVRTGAPHAGHDDCVIALALAAWHLQPRPIWNGDDYEDDALGEWRESHDDFPYRDPDCFSSFTPSW